MTGQDTLRNELKSLIDTSDERLLRILLAVIKEYQPAKKDQTGVLYRLVYTSARRSNCSDSEIEKILEASRKNNAKLGITGILIHTKDRFLQVLDGEKDKVKALYQKIEKDDRHGGSIMRFCEPVAGRHFSDWEMAGKKVDEDTVQFHTAISKQKMAVYRSMMDGDLSSYKDEGMRVLKTFLMVS